MATPGFPITEAQLTGLFVEAILFGIHLITLGFCLRTLFTTGSRRRRWDEVHWEMVAVSLALFTVAVIDLTLAFYHDLKAFVFYTGQGGSMTEFVNISDWINICKSVTIVVQVMIADAMLIYRCWVVHDRLWIPIAFSLSLWLGCFVISIWIIYTEATLREKVLVSANQLLPLEFAFCAVTIVLNIVTTGLLVWRIWRVENGNKVHHIDRIGSNQQHRSYLQKVIRIVVESGLFFTITALITFFTYATMSNGAYVITDAGVQLAGISFDLIIIRASRILSEGENYTTSSTTPCGILPFHTTNPDSQITRSGTLPKTEAHLFISQTAKKEQI